MKNRLKHCLMRMRGTLWAVLYAEETQKKICGLLIPSAVLRIPYRRVGALWGVFLASRAITHNLGAVLTMLFRHLLHAKSLARATMLSLLQLYVMQNPFVIVRRHLCYIAQEKTVPFLKHPQKQQRLIFILCVS